MRIRTRIIIAAMVVIATLTIIFSYYFLSKERDESISQLQATIEENARLFKVVLSGPLYDGNLSQIRQSIDSLFKNPDIKYLALTEFNGDIEVVQERTEEIEKGRLIESRVTITRGIDDLGELVIRYSTHSIDQRFSKSLNEIATFSILLMLLISLVIYLIARGLTNPIENLTLVARKMAEGDLNQDIELSGAEELVDLGKSFARMRDSIREKIADLAEKNEQLINEIKEHDYTQRALIESERKYRTFFEKAINPMLIVKGTQFIDGNAAVLKMLGLSSVEELKKLSIEDISPEFQPDGTPSIIDINERRDKLSDVGKSTYFETYHQRCNGELFPVAVSATVISIEGEQIKHAIWQDISDRKQAEEELLRYRLHLEELVRERTNELRAVNKELEAFSYSVSHDLRAPLRAIDGFSLALIEDYGDKFDDIGTDYLKRVRNGAQEMAALIDSMLQLSRMSRVEMHIDEVNLSELSREIMARLQNDQPERDVVVNIYPEMKVMGDKGLLKILLDNLLGNAWKYTAKKKQAKIEFGFEQTEKGRNYFIRDNGAGFDMRYKDKLFGAFQRLHHVDEFEGTGIGLATVQRVIARHHGRVWAEAKLNKGATFYFSLSDSALLNESAGVSKEEKQVTTIE